MTGLCQSETVDQGKCLLDVSGFEIFDGMWSNIELELAIGFFLLRDVPDVEPFRNQLSQERIDGLLIEPIKAIGCVDNVLNRIVLHGGRQTRGVREIINLLKEGKPIVQRLPVLLGISVIDALSTKQLNVAREDIKNFLTTLHALRC